MNDTTYRHIEDIATECMEIDAIGYGLSSEIETLIDSLDKKNSPADNQRLMRICILNGIVLDKAKKMRDIADLTLQRLNMMGEAKEAANVAN